MLKVTTESGAIYYISTDGVVKGGSKELTNGRLLLSAMVGVSLWISTPERAKQNPTTRGPGVLSTPVVSIEIVKDDDAKRT